MVSAIKTVAEHFASIPDGCFRLLEKSEIPDQAQWVNPPNIIGWETQIAYKGSWIKIIITLTSHFPFRLPRIYFISPPRQIPHMTPSRDNDICIAERHSTFLDIASPSKLVFESNERAEK
jgi:ubiquitin-protein ligase